MAVPASSDVINLPNQPSSTPAIKLDTIPGIGKKIKEKLLSHYHSEAEILKAFQTGTIRSIPGISFKQAFKFSQSYWELMDQLFPETVLKTSDIQEIYNDLLEIIRKYTKTEYSKLKLQLFFPLPIRKHGLILERQQTFRKAVEFVNKYRTTLESNGFSRLLYRLDTLTQSEEIPLIKTRILMSDSSKVVQLLDGEELGDKITWEMFSFEKLKEGGRMFENTCQNYDVVFYCGENPGKVPLLSNLILLSYEELKKNVLIPELIIQNFAQNKQLIQSMIKIVFLLKNLKDEGLIQEFIDLFDLKTIKIFKDNLGILDENGEILPTVDSALDLYRSLLQEYNSLISETENEINEQIQHEVGDRSVNLHGKQILEFYRPDISVESMRSYVPPEVDDLIGDAITKNLDKLTHKLHLNREDADLIAQLNPEVIEIPVQLNENGVSLLQKHISARYNTYKYNTMVKIAKTLQETYNYLLDLHQTLLEFEFFYAIGQFAMDFHLSIPLLQREVRGFFGDQMINLQLAASLKLGLGAKEFPVIPIKYHIGHGFVNQSSEIPSAHLALLTGSNSGGKTMCLLTCVQGVILAQMGFPTIGQLEFYPFDELYYFKKSSGQLSAGAFENTLVQFIALIRSPHLKLVLADELESITEPQAAAKVLSGIFELFLQNPQNYGVFVTHLVELLQREINLETRTRIRIDGIEASGLDENLELIVDRSPRFNFIARSTPELILTRLAKLGSTDQQVFFTSLLSKFK